MTTKETPSSISLEEVEFELPCEVSVAPCELPARWALWLAHTVAHCNVTTNVCDLHKKMVDELWRAAIALQPPACPHCGQPIGDRLEDNMRWIRL